MCGYDFMREGDKWDMYFIILYLPILVLVGKNWLHEILGECYVVLN
jgi:hypothetical protein